MSKEIRQTSIKLPMDLFEKIQREAKLNHRSISGQIAFFCASSVAPSATKQEVS